MRVLIVVPALNEESGLPPLLTELRAASSQGNFSAEIVVIDDASTDRTADVAREHGARVVRLCRNLGIGGAVQTGLRLALREGFDCAVQMDGDGQHPPSELKKLLAPMEMPSPPDIVVGSRYLQGVGFQSSLPRRVGSNWLRGVLRMVTHETTTDPTSGYRVYGRRALKLFNWSYPHDYPEPEALVLAKLAGLRVTEVPVVMKERQGGSSSIRRLQAPYYMLKVTAAILLAYARGWHRIESRAL
ncbi:MAG TPA: glycosyltransferase family 2 protein [Polyangia bacterium]